MFESLRGENNQLRQQSQCKICMDKEVSVVFLPCGHFVSCNDCSFALKICPVCRDMIKGVVRAFLKWLSWKRKTKKNSFLQIDKIQIFSHYTWNISLKIKMKITTLSCKHFMLCLLKSSLPVFFFFLKYLQYTIISETVILSQFTKQFKNILFGL